VKFSPAVPLIVIGLIISLLCLAPFPQALAARRQISSPYNGKTIRNITINIHPIFEGEELPFLYRAANTLKIASRQKIVRRELLFKEGDPYDELHIRESVRRLRLLKYLRRISIKPQADGDYVDIIVEVQDTWTFIPQFSYSTGVGRDKRTVGVAESNVLGYGNRLEVAYQQDEAREIVAGVFEDNRVFNSANRLLGAYLQRSDGHQAVFYYGRPLRTLFDRKGWYFNTELSDTVGRLFRNGSVEYIFRQENEAFNLRYTVARGKAEKGIHRFSLGYDFIQDRFSRADIQDYQDLDLSPAVVSNNPARLPQDRRYSGLVLAHQYIKPDYVSMNYIDRFDRVEDYNLGLEHDQTIVFAPEAFGSYEDNLLFTGNISHGLKFSYSSFLRAELGLASRLRQQGFSNTLLRAELKYYNVLGDLCIGELFAGRHTLASSFLLDYGDRLDRDRQFTVGGDNGLRGYAARAFTGDKRFVLNLEDRIHFIDDAFKLVSVGAAFFADIGGASYDDIQDLLASQIYSNIGAGLRIAFPRSAGAQVLRLDFSLPLRSAADGGRAWEIRVIISGGQLFNARFRSETLGPEKANVAVGQDR